MKSSSLIYLVACVLFNFGFLSLLRGFGSLNWIVGSTSGNERATWKEFPIKATISDFYILLLVVLLSLMNILAIRIRGMGKKIFPSTVASALLGLLQGVLLLVIVIPFISKYPTSEYVYAVGGIPALISATISNLLGSMLVFINLFHLHDYKLLTVEERNYELSAFLLMLLVATGALIFSNLEPWNFEKAAEFSMMTLLTIGYGDIVPKSPRGKIFMVVYTIFGLCIIMFYLLSFEQLDVWSDMDYKQVFDELDTDVEEICECRASNRSPLKEAELTVESNDTTNIYVPIDDVSKLKQISRNALNLARQSIFRAIIGVLLWLFGFSVIFYLTESTWTFFDSFYYTFVTITAIGFGDYQVTSPLGIEFWWIFLFNAVSVLTYCVGVAGKIVSINLNEKDLKEQSLKYRNMLKYRLANFRASKFLGKNRRMSIDPVILPQRQPTT